MITPYELAQVPLFALLSSVQRDRVCRTAADLRVRAGDWLTQEGDLPYFFVVLEGSVEFLKEFGGETEPVEIGRAHV